MTDLANPDNDFEQYDTIFMMTNNSRYFGYIISTNAGISHRIRDFSNVARGEVSNEDFTSFFINVILGFEDES